MDAQATVTVVIDGREVVARPGSMIIEAADAAQIYIPRFCYHPKLSIAANCRMCLVEVEKAPKPLPACATPVADGMVVQTRSELAVEAQQGTMEFLLINHPLDCPVCDQGGECPLQDQAMGYGQDFSRYQEDKRAKAPLDLGPLVATAMTRCIHCTRCVRFGSEIAGTMELGATGRGEDMTIETYLNGSVDSEVSGNIIDLCPVGALTSKPYRFTARPWELLSHSGISPHDSLGTNITFQTAHHAVKRVVPRVNEGINECWISDRDRFAYEGAECDDRLTQPMVRRREGLMETSWEEALGEASAAMQAAARQGQAGLAALIHPISSVEECFLLQKIVRALGSNHIDHRLFQRDFSDDPVSPAYPGLGVALADVELLKGLLLVGCNPRKEAPLLALRIRKMVSEGGVVGAIGPRALDANFDVAAQQCVNPSRLTGVLCDLIEKVGTGDVERPSFVDGGSVRNADDTAFQALAEVFGQARGDGAIVLGQYALNHRDGAGLRLAAAKLAQQTGMRLGVLAPANSAGAWWAGAVPHRGPEGALSAGEGANASEMTDLNVHTALLYGLEPAIDHADPARLNAMLDRAKKVIAFSTFRSAVPDQADVVLPIAPYTESSGSFINCNGTMQFSRAALAPQGNSRPGWKVLRVLGNFLSLPDFDYDDISQVSEALKTPPAVTMQPVGAKLQKPDRSQNEQAIAQEAFFLIGELAIYQSDPVVRRSPALAKTHDGLMTKSCRLHPDDLAARGLPEGAKVQVAGAHHRATLQVVADSGVTRGCIFVFLGSPETAAFGADSTLTINVVD